MLQVIKSFLIDCKWRSSKIIYCTVSPLIWSIMRGVEMLLLSLFDVFVLLAQPFLSFFSPIIYASHFQGPNWLEFLKTRVIIHIGSWFVSQI